MIVPMKEVTLLVYEDEKEKALSVLRQWGLLHIKEREIPSGPGLLSLKEEQKIVEEALGIIKSLSLPSRNAPKCRKEENLSLVARRIIDLAKEKEILLSQQKAIEKDAAWYEEWGRVSLADVDYLKGKGIEIVLLRCRRRDLRSLEGLAYTILKKKGGTYLVAVFSEGSFRGVAGCQKEAWPQRSLEEIRREKHNILLRLDAISSEMNSEGELKLQLETYLKELKRQEEWQRARANFSARDKIAFIQGYIPYDQQKSFSVLAQRHRWGVVISEPEDFSAVPTLVRNPWWIRIIEPVFKFMGTVPGYKEFDISLVFLFFLSLFFAMLVGDGGYGLVFLMASFLLQRKRKAPREFFMLMYVFSIATIIWGAISGTWFGYEKIAQLPFLRCLVVDRLNSFIADNQNFIMYISFLIGAIHLSIAHLWRAVRFSPSRLSLGEVGWVGIIISVFFLAQKLVLGKALAPFVVYLFSLSLLLVAFFSRAEKNLMRSLFLTLQDLPLKIIGSFSDVVSYLRLFAVGYATVVLAQSVNGMAGEFGLTNVTTSFISALILFFGHALNILLGIMAVIVHGIRLNMLEFSSHLGMQWQGREYHPFK